MFLTEILIILASVIGIITQWLKYHYNYWQRHKIPYIKAHPIFGNFKDIVLWKKDPCAHFQSLYNEQGVVGGKPKDNPVVGLHVFNKPCLLIRDLDLVKNVLIKDFNQFSNRYSYSDPHSDAVGANTLFFAKNPKWKNIRSKLTPVFASGKIKQMFPLVEEIGRELDKYLCKLTEKTPNTNVHEVKDINALYTTDVIATVAYGVQANSLVNPDGDFRTNGKRIFDFTTRRSLEFSCMFFLPKLVKLMKFKFFSPETTTFLRKTITYVMDERSKSGMKRNDLIDILVKFRKDAETDKSHFANELDSVIAQAAIFFSAGFETSSGTMSFALYELAKHPDVQQRVRDEIREALQQSETGELSYEQLNELKYLNNVILEVLRFYPPLPFLDRECTADKGYSLQPHVDFTIPPGMPVYIAASALQMDPRFFTEPEKFEPDRFNSENKLYNNLGAYMPFGVGPHNCIGERFGMIQTKVGLFNFLRNHYVTTCEKTSPEMKLSPYALIIQSEDGIYLNLVRDPLV
ncbi:probable cytochrome P450 6g2 isoform X1 [Calliphora vicina]|uniref:probable cytochrome P450 6g2 isoform X1 n=1 Tax=Calliphora vicina TaxID=7373 RepID=UPI00325B0C45